MKKKSIEPRLRTTKDLTKVQRRLNILVNTIQKALDRTAELRVELNIAVDNAAELMQNPMLNTAAIIEFHHLTNAKTAMGVTEGMLDLAATNLD